MKRMVSSVAPRLAHLLLAVAIVLAGLTLTTAPSRADVNLTVTPSLLDVQATAGGTTDQPIVLENDSTDPVDLAVEIVPPTGVPDSFLALGWLTIDQTTIHIDPESAATMVVGLEIPAGADSGGHYGNIRLTTVGAQGSDGTALAGEIIVPVLFNVDGDGDIARTAEIRRFSAFLENDGRIGFRAELANTGNTHLLAPGTVAIAGPDGKRITSLDLMETTFILPGQTRDLQASGTLPLQPETDYTASVALGVDGTDAIRAETTFRLDDLQPDPLALSVCENVDGGPTVSIGVANESSLGLTPTIHLTVQDALAAKVVDTALPPGLLLWPSDEENLSAQLPERLASGSYILTGEIQVGTDDPVSTQLTFAIGGTGPDTAPICAA